MWEHEDLWGTGGIREGTEHSSNPSRRTNKVSQRRLNQKISSEIRKVKKEMEEINTQEIQKYSEFFPPSRKINISKIWINWSEYLKPSNVLWLFLWNMRLLSLFLLLEAPPLPLLLNYCCFRLKLSWKYSVKIAERHKITRRFCSFPQIWS